MRAILTTFGSRIEAELAVARLAECGIASSAMSSSLTPDFYFPNGPTELWIENAELLDRPEVRDLIEDALNGLPLTPGDEEAIAAIRWEEPEPPRSSYALWALALFALVIAVGVAVNFLTWDRLKLI